MIKITPETNEEILRDRVAKYINDNPYGVNPEEDDRSVEEVMELQTEIEIEYASCGIHLYALRDCEDSDEDRELYLVQTYMLYPYLAEEDIINQEYNGKIYFVDPGMAFLTASEAPMADK